MFLGLRAVGVMFGLAKSEWMVRLGRLEREVVVTGGGNRCGFRVVAAISGSLGYGVFGFVMFLREIGLAWVEERNERRKESP